MVCSGGSGSQNFNLKMMEFEDFFFLLPEWTSVFAASPVLLVVSDAAVQQSGRIQRKLLGQGHKPWVVLS